MTDDGTPLDAFGRARAATPGDPPPAAVAPELGRLLMLSKFGLEEMLTKVNILREELTQRTLGSPIEHVSSRLKSLESLMAKAERLHCASLDDITERIFDIAGIRIVCSFIPDTYEVLEMLTRQPDVTVRTVKDYIASPKSNGYRSLHVIAEIPVFLSEEVRDIRVEVQIRTVAMDFWASVEHKIHYKYDAHVPPELREELVQAAETAHDLDERMNELRRRVHGLREPDGGGAGVD